MFMLMAETDKGNIPLMVSFTNGGLLDVAQQLNLEQVQQLADCSGFDRPSKLIRCLLVEFVQGEVAGVNPLS